MDDGRFKALQQMDGIGVHIGDEIFKLGFKLFITHEFSEMFFPHTEIQKTIEAELTLITVVVVVEVIGMNEIMHSIEENELYV